MTLAETLIPANQSTRADYRARYYAENDARFLTPDWSSAPEAVPYADLTNPQSLNLYAFTLNNPLSGVDPDGHQSGCFQTTSSSGGVMTVNVYCSTLPLSSSIAIRAPNTYPSWDALPGPSPITHKIGPTPQRLLIGAVGPADFGELGDELVAWEEASALSDLTPSERQIVKELESQGHKVVPIPRGAGKTADFMVDGVETEFKHLTSAGPNTLKNAIQSAAGQTNGNILIDARDVNISAADVKQQILRAEGNVGSLSGRVTVLTSNGTVNY